MLNHTVEVIDAAELLFGEPDAQPTWRRVVTILPTRSRVFDLFARTLRAAAGFHDLGKANDGFRDALNRTGDQAIRHEHFSTLLMFDPRCWKWLTRQTDVDWEVALSAVLTHHLQAPEADLIRSLSTPSKYVRLLVGEELNELTAAIRTALI